MRSLEDGMRVLVATVATVATGVFLVAVGGGSVALLDIRPPSRSEDQTVDLAAESLMGRAIEGFRLERLGLPDGAPLFRVTGRRLVRPEPPEAPFYSGFRIEEPRADTFRRGERVSHVEAPRGHVTSLASKGPLRAVLEGGVRVSGRGTVLEVEELAVEAGSSSGPRAGNLAIERLLNERGAPRLDARLPVRGTVVRAPPDPWRPLELLGLLAEGGVSARGDLRRLELLGPVHLRDPEGKLVLEAGRRVVVTLAPSPRLLFSRLDGPGASLGGLAPLGRELPGGLVVSRLEAEGQVELGFWRAGGGHGARAPLDVRCRGERIVCDLLRGTLEVSGSPGSVEERVSGRAIAAPRILARDLGADGIRVEARGGFTASAHVKRSRRTTVARDWDLGGDALDVRLGKRVRSKGVPELTLREARVSTTPDHPGTFSSRTGAERGTFGSLSSWFDEEQALRVEVEGHPHVEVVTDGSRLRARAIRFRRVAGDADRLRLEGDVLGVLGTDLAAIAVERDRGKSALEELGKALALDRPVRLEAASVDLQIDPKPVDPDREVAWFEKSALIGARLDGQPARIEGTTATGGPFRVEGSRVELDLLDGKLAVDAWARGPAVAWVGSGGLTARKVRGDLKEGRLDATGDVRGRFDAGAASLALEGERVSALLVADPERLREIAARRAALPLGAGGVVGVPEELRAFEATGAPCRVSSEAGELHASRLAWDAARATLVAESAGDLPARVSSSSGSLTARRIEVREGSPAVPRVYAIAADGGVHLEGQVPGERGGTRLALEADRLAATAHASAPLGRAEVALAEVEAWVEGTSPLVLRASGADERVEARGRVLRAHPEVGEAVLLGRPGEPPAILRGEDRVEAQRITLGLVDPAADERSLRVGLEGEVRAALASGKLDASGRALPFELRADRARAEIELAAARRPAPRGPRRDDDPAVTERALALLRAVRSFAGDGDVRVRFQDQRFEADDLAYDGRTREAVLRGDPVRATDPATGRYETREVRIYLGGDDPGAPRR